MDTEMLPKNGQAQFSLPHEMHEFQRGDRFLFFDPVNFVWFQTDWLGKAVIDGLAQDGSMLSAAHEVAQRANAPIKAALFYAQRAIEQLVQLGFLHNGEYQRQTFHSGIAEVPFILYLHMTARCNLRCPYCYNQDNRSQLWHAPIGSYEQFASVIDEAAELGFREVKFTGGEALLNRDTLRLARHARSKNLYVNLLTNGTLVDETNAREIVEVVNSVSLSLDSVHPEEHDAVRGKNTWEKVLQAIKLLREAGLQFLHLNSVITPVNQNSVIEFLEFAWDELKAQKVTLAPTGMDVPDPSGKLGAKEHMLSPEGMWKVYEAQSKFQHRKAADHPPIIPRNRIRRTHCGVGNGLVSVDSNGDLYPCQTMHTPELRCGNVFETSLRELLETSGLLHSLRNMTVDLLEDCPTCPMRYVCNGGCRMEAYTREGRLNARNRDLCPLFFTRALDKLWMTANLPVGQQDTASDKQETPLDFFESYT